MKLHRTTRFNPELLGLVPLVNVLVLVLAFLTLSRNFVLSPGIAVNLPLSSFALGSVRDAAVVTITGGSVPRIYLSDRRVTMDELAAALLERDSQENVLLLRADQTTPYNVISEVTHLGLSLGYSVSLAAESARR